jgi:hypothetical protein
VAHHAGLREGEAQEDPHGEERDQRMGAAAKEHDQPDGQGPDDHNAVGVGEPQAAVLKLARQIPIVGHDRGEQREAVERGIRRQHQDQRGGELDQPEERATARHGLANLGDHAGPGGGDGADGVAQAGYPQEEGTQDHSKRDERAGGVARLRLFEHRHAIGDGLHAGHGRAPPGKGA